MDDILVSICCATYNQENFIGDALEGFLMQKTEFNFEVLIHDDASTDRTAEIIREYQKEYPHIIKPIFQTENQYSKGIKIDPVYNFPRTKGKYLALCEGDDYWIDPYKLQKQVDYMETHPDCTLCFHNALVVDVNKRPIGIHIPFTKWNEKYYYGESREYTAGELILLNFVPYASMLFPKQAVEELPDFFFSALFGDLPLRLILAHKGYAYYIDEIMSSYRRGAAGSYTSSVASSVESMIRHDQGYLEILDNFNCYSAGLYEKEINRAKLIREFSMLLKRRDVKGLYHPRFKLIWEEEFNLASKVRIYLRLHYPRLYSVYAGIEGKIGKIRANFRQA